MMKRILFLIAILLLIPFSVWADFPNQQQVQQRLYSKAAVSRPNVHIVGVNKIFFSTEKEYQDFLFRQAKLVLGNSSSISLEAFKSHNYVKADLDALKKFPEVQQHLQTIASLGSAPEVLDQAKLLTFFALLDAEITEDKKVVMDAKSSTGEKGGLVRVRDQSIQVIYRKFQDLIKYREQLDAALHKAEEQLKNIQVFEKGRLSASAAARAVGVISEVPSLQKQEALARRVFGADIQYTSSRGEVYIECKDHTTILLDPGVLGEAVRIYVIEPGQAQKVFDKTGKINP